jgi:hypothetical protein
MVERLNVRAWKLALASIRVSRCVRACGRGRGVSEVENGGRGEGFLRVLRKRRREIGSKWKTHLIQAPKI